MESEPSADSIWNYMQLFLFYINRGQQSTAFCKETIVGYGDWNLGIDQTKANWLQIIYTPLHNCDLHFASKIGMDVFLSNVIVV